jgi:hypothetical protein
MARNPPVLGALFALACVLGAAPARAQAARVNDCTLLTDPTLLQACVERARQGGNSAAPTQSGAQDAFAPNRGDAAGSAAARRGAEARKGKAGTSASTPSKGRGEASRGGKIP